MQISVYLDRSTPLIDTVASNLRIVASYTLAGYGIAILVSLYVLWTFGRIEGTSASQTAAMVTVLAFPSALGAALARLVV